MLIPFSLGRGKGTAQRPLPLPHPCSLINSWETTTAQVCPLDWLPLTQQMSLSKPENRGFFSLCLSSFFSSIHLSLPPSHLLSFLPTYLPSLLPSSMCIQVQSQGIICLKSIIAYLSPVHIGFSPIHIPYSHPLQPP